MAIDYDHPDLTPEARAAVQASGLIDRPKNVWNMKPDQVKRLNAIGKACAIPQLDTVLADLSDQMTDAQRDRPIPRPNKYGAKPKVYRGVRYDSEAEAVYAGSLSIRKLHGEVAWWLRQVKIPLGEDFSTRVDFLVAVVQWDFHLKRIYVQAHEVKGFETAQFRKVRKLWPKYAPFDLHIIKRGQVEVIEGA